MISDILITIVSELIITIGFDMIDRSNINIIQSSRTTHYSINHNRFHILTLFILFLFVLLNTLIISTSNQIINLQLQLSTIINLIHSLFTFLIMSRFIITFRFKIFIIFIFILLSIL